MHRHLSSAFSNQEGTFAACCLPRGSWFRDPPPQQLHLQERCWAVGSAQKQLKDHSLTCPQTLREDSCSLWCKWHSDSTKAALPSPPHHPHSGWRALGRVSWDPELWKTTEQLEPGMGSSGIRGRESFIPRCYLLWTVIFSHSITCLINPHGYTYNR